MKIRTLKDVKVHKKCVLVRVDFNLVLDDGFQVAEDTRIVETLPTINYLLEKGAKVILASHLGRPGGKVDPRFSIKPVAKRTAEHLKRKITLIDQFWEDKGVEEVKKLDFGQVAILENTRFHPGEEQNSQELSKRLGSLAEIFVNDCFGTAHRAHASTVGVTEFIPSYAGFLMEKEIKVLSQAIKSPKRPLVVMIGGAKTPDKIAAVERLLNTADAILLGGAVANTFLCTWGIGTGCSLVDHEMIETARSCLWKATRTPTALLLPTDVVTVNPKKGSEVKVVNYKKISKDQVIYDIGPKTQKLYARHIEEAGTIIWNGPMGFYEKEKFA
jgi:phosphoglycerate kinase